MKLKNVLISVKDIERLKKFYHDLFGLEAVLDSGDLTGGTCPSGQKCFSGTILQNCILRNATWMRSWKKLERLYPRTQYVNKLMTYSWGQKVVRFYDPDGNLIEVRSPA